jgi:2-polyprenyl-3-methyl-5-hydroxy-6-metoxy-1,4-benzoquinol methylase
MAVDEQRLNAFLGKAVGDLGAAVSAVLVSIGDELGLYKALAAGPLTAGQLAAKAAANERYVREWLANQAAGGYVEYDASNETFFLTPEQALCLADPNGPVDVPGAYSIVRDLFHIRDRALENFRTGQGMEWGEHHQCLFHGTERFFRASYNAHLLTSWLPALDGAVAKLQQGARVADVGCGHGASTILMAQAFPASTFVGIDYHPSSIDTAQQRAAAAGVANARFEVADATSYGGDRYDVIAFFDCLHDMADPGGVARHAGKMLKSDGHVMVVEPFADDRLENNLNPVGRVYYGASTMVCVPVSLAKNGPALGAQAGERRLRDTLVNDGGFSRVRRATETPFNMVLEARP